MLSLAGAVSGTCRIWGRFAVLLLPPTPPGDRGAALCGLPCGSVTKQLRHGPPSPPRSRGTTCLPSVLGSLPRCLAGISAHLSALGHGGRGEGRAIVPASVGMRVPMQAAKRCDGARTDRRNPAPSGHWVRFYRRDPHALRLCIPSCSPKIVFRRWFLSHSMHLVMSPALHAEETGRGASLFVSVVTFCGAVVPR